MAESISQSRPVKMTNWEYQGSKGLTLAGIGSRQISQRSSDSPNACLHACSDSHTDTQATLK